MSFLDSLPTRLKALEASVLPDLTLMVQNYARDNGWPREAWTALKVDFQDAPDATGWRGYSVKYWRQPGEHDIVRESEFGFGAEQAPIPVGRKMATRLPQTAAYLINRRLS